jgi:hypothetical protein
LHVDGLMADLVVQYLSSSLHPTLSSGKELLCLERERERERERLVRGGHCS